MVFSNLAKDFLFQMEAKSNQNSVVILLNYQICVLV